MEWTLEVVVLSVSDIDRAIGFYRDQPDGNSWAIQEIKARAVNPLLPQGHTGLRDWADG